MTRAPSIVKFSKQLRLHFRGRLRPVRQDDDEVMDSDETTGQLISECLFDVFNFPKKTTKKIDKFELPKCKFVSGQLIKLVALPDPKFKKRPNFFFKTAKFVERFFRSVKTIRLVTLIPLSWLTR